MSCYDPDCQDCVDRMRKYGARSGCDKHCGADVIAKFTITDASPALIKLITGQDPQ